MFISFTHKFIVRRDPRGLPILLRQHQPPVQNQSSECQFFSTLETWKHFKFFSSLLTFEFLSFPGPSRRPRSRMLATTFILEAFVKQLFLLICFAFDAGYIYMTNPQAQSAKCFPFEAPILFRLYHSLYGSSHKLRNIHLKILQEIFKRKWSSKGWC